MTEDKKTVELVPGGEGSHQPEALHYYEDDWKSIKIDKLATSLARAQSELKGAESKSKNPFFNSNYADLHTVIQSSLPALTKHGLSIIQGNRYCTATNGFYVTTTLLHESGQWIKSEIRMPMGAKKDAHAVGRYGFSAMTAVAQYDDDGNVATGNNPKVYKKEE